MEIYSCIMHEQQIESNAQKLSKTLEKLNLPGYLQDGIVVNVAICYY